MFKKYKDKLKKIPPNLYANIKTIELNPGDAFKLDLTISTTKKIKFIEYELEDYIYKKLKKFLKSKTIK